MIFCSVSGGIGIFIKLKFVGLILLIFVLVESDEILFR